MTQTLVPKRAAGAPFIVPALIAEAGQRATWRCVRAFNLTTGGA